MRMPGNMSAFASWKVYGWVPYHGANVRMRHSVELLVVELIIGPNVDVGSPVLGRVAISGGGEDWAHVPSATEGVE